MTQKNRSGIPPTEFSDWLRNQSRISSNKGFRATNLDYIWNNTYSGKWMMIEEKRRMVKLTSTQIDSFSILHKLALQDENYVGFYLIQFENTSPEDGRIFITDRFNKENNKPVEVNKEQLIEFLRSMKIRKL